MWIEIEVLVEHEVVGMLKSFHFYVLFDIPFSFLQFTFTHCPDAVPLFFSSFCVCFLFNIAGHY